MEYDECFKRRLLIRIEPDRGLVLTTLDMARSDLEESEMNYDNGRFVWSLIQAYTSMLNYARAVMFSEGVREKSHACAVEYLRVNHGQRYGDMIHAFDSLRRERHSMMYDSRHGITKERVEITLEWLKDFQRITEELLKDIIE